MKMFVGTYTENILFGTGEVLHGKGEGIYVYDFDPMTGGLQLISVSRGIANPSYLTCSPCGTYLYAVNELKEYAGINSGSVSSYTIDRNTIKLTLRSIQPSFGTDPCHLMTNRTGSRLFLANFMSGNIAWYAVHEDGCIGEVLQVIQHEGSSTDAHRQAGPHAHAAVVSPDDRFLYIPDLGTDEIMVYSIDYDQNMLILRQTIRTKPGSGPRFLVFHPHISAAYVINELDSTIYVYRYHKEDGNLSYIAAYSTLPPDFKEHSTCSDIRIIPSGEFLYASNRGHDSLAHYRIDQKSGKLTFLAHTSTLGKCPRNFTIDPSGKYVLAANQNSDTIAVFSIDATSGMLESTGAPVYAPTPVCLCFLPMHKA